jgi:phosphopantothenoylcysteine decarboxylase/phosphopantothenate--cysteine ligase
MAEVAQILSAIHELLNRKNDLSGKKMLITAGPTREPIDPVRYISNRSSGKMGYAIAEQAVKRGADVTLVSGPVSIAVPAGVELIKVETADQMFQAVSAISDGMDIIIGAAAVADYRTSEIAELKMKKSESHKEISLEPTTDILAMLGKQKSDGQILVGFAAETDNLEQNSLAKLKTKNLDFVVANDVTLDGAGFDVETNIVTIYTKDGSKTHLPIMSKREVADRLLDVLVEYMRAS